MFVLFIKCKNCMTSSESKGRFFYKTNRFESIRVTNRIVSNRELECSTGCTSLLYVGRTSICSGLVVGLQVVRPLAWQDFDWHIASRGPSATAELAVPLQNSTQSQSHQWVTRSSFVSRHASASARGRSLTSLCYERRRLFVYFVGEQLPGLVSGNKSFFYSDNVKPLCCTHVLAASQ